MVDVRVHATIAYQSHQVQRFLIFFCILKGSLQGGIACQDALTDGYIDALQLLVYHAAGTEVQVTHFRVAHLSFRQSYCFTAGGEGCMGKFGIKRLYKGNIGILDRIGVLSLSQPPAVHYDEDNFALWHCVVIDDKVQIYENVKVLFILNCFWPNKVNGIFFDLKGQNQSMKQALLSITAAFTLITAVAFAPVLSIDSVISALRTGNAVELAKYMDDNIDLTLPDKSDTYSKAQAVLILKDFFSRNGVSGFEVKHKGDNSGSQYCIGMLQTRSGVYRTTVFMKADGSRQLIKEIRFQP
jgi:hypothetical protein